ncbi:YdcF family protein [uncultured Paludibaculum sp.]|uniref:YdcF family protein n=1 Tax=uncultured Paludibaculum sp. TaxID=1765020 RepID=UPI002AAAFB72|nr:YdcF family protein [uncultured Paludibaculum sp.]
MAHPGRRSRGFAYLPVLIFIAICILLWWQGARILSAAGDFLDVGEPPQKAQAAVVLAGGWAGERVMRGGQLARAGYVPLVLLSGPQSFFGQSECVPAMTFAMKQGFDPAWFQCIENDSTSTKGEAITILHDLRRRGLKKVLIVSVASHLRRARRVYQTDAPADLEMHFVAADPPGFKLHEWYKSREGRKAIFFEYTKYLSAPLGF